MELLAQELLEDIIDHVPRKNTPSCSLVARRWRRRSQQHHFRDLIFSREHEVVSWYTNVSQDPDGIPSYVHDVEFQSIRVWRDPTRLSRVLECFSRVKILTFSETGIPSDEVRKLVSSDKFGRDVISLTFISPVSTIPTLMSLTLSLPNLRELMIDFVVQAEPTTFIPPDKTWERGPLQSLELSWLSSTEIASIVLYGVLSRKVDLSVRDVTMDKIIVCSSETIQELRLQDVDDHVWPVDVFPPMVCLPLLRALTSMKLEIRSGTLSPRLADVLSCIRRAPALSSITFKYPKWTGVEDLPTSAQWIGVDKSLARLAMEVKPKRDLVVILTPWLGGSLSWENYLPGFRRAGGELRVCPGAQTLISSGVAL